MDNIATIVMLVVVVAASVAYVLSAHGRDLYLGRSCQGRRWREAFPGIPKQEIRTFLRFFAEGFAIRDKHVLQVAPQDELLQLYHARYPSRGGADCLEFEALAQGLHEQFGISFGKLWHDHLTVGELFSRVHAAQQIAAADRHPATRAAGG